MARKFTSSNIHLVAGLFAALWVVILGVTGALLVFENEIDRALNPKISYVTPQGQPIALDELVSRQLAQHPGWELVRVGLPLRADLSTRIEIGDPKTHEGIELAVNRYTGEVLGDSDHANHFMDRVRQFHTRLLLGNVGSVVLWFSAVAMTMLSITGVMLWWKRKRFAPCSAQGVVYWIDLHGAIGIYCALFAFIFAITAIRPIPPPLVMKVPFGPIPRVTAAAGATRLSVAQMISVAERELQGARVEWLGRTGDGPLAPMIFSLRYPEDRSEHPRSFVFLDPYTGAVLRKTDLHQLTAAAKFAWEWDMEIHTGAIFGMPTKILAVIFSAVIPLLGLTGPVIWWMKRQRGVLRAAAD